jgi:hypothetical protein
MAAREIEKARKPMGPSPMGSAPYKGTMGSGSSNRNAKGVMGSGRDGGSMAKGVQGKG